MYCSISSRASHLVSNIGTLRPTPNGASKLLRRVNAPVSARPRPDVHRQFLGHATFFSSGQKIDFSSHGLDTYRNAGPDPYSYTSGRWLRHDALERDSRLIHFDFDALCRRVLALCPGASSVTSYDKKEGGFNRVFIFHTDNAKRIVARLPFALAGPSRFCTEMIEQKWLYN
jgi:hypothetical protein